MAVTHCLDSNVLVYAFSKAPRDAAKARVAREWIAREDWGVTWTVRPFGIRKKANRR